MFSVIPVPALKTGDEDDKYAMCAFPLVGAVIAGLGLAFYVLFANTDMGTELGAGVMTLIPFTITGGIHMDGYMDTSDALNSYGDKTRKLEILKDPHIGAFAAIRGVCHVLFTFVLWNELLMRLGGGTADIRLLYAVLTGYVISRILSALAVFSFKKAKDDGMLSDLRKRGDTRCRYILFAMLFAVSAASVLYAGYYALAAVIPAVMMFVYYRSVAYRGFGGITGDLAGWFLQKCEQFILLMAVVWAVISGIRR